MPDIVAAILSIGLLVLWIYCIYDVIVTDDAIIRHLPKVVWLIIVLILPDIGSILWLALGRPQVWSRRAHDPQRYGGKQFTGSGRSDRSPVAEVEDEASFEHLSPIVRYREEQARLRMREAQLNRREEELRLREFGEGPSS